MHRSRLDHGSNQNEWKDASKDGASVGIHAARLAASSVIDDCALTSLNNWGTMVGLFSSIRQYLKDSAAVSTRTTTPSKPLQSRQATAPKRQPVVHPEFGIRKVQRQGMTVTIETRDFSKSRTVDLRHLPASDFGIQGYSYYVDNKWEQMDDVYRLVREPLNRHDANAIAVFSGPRKIGFVSASKAANYASILDAIVGDSFFVGGVERDRGKMVLQLPQVSALREFAKRH